MAVGVFTKDFIIAHGVVAYVAFFLSSVAAFAQAKTLKVVPGLTGLMLGATTFAAFTVFSTGLMTCVSITGTFAYDSFFYLSLGPMSIESMIVFPSLMWDNTLFSGFLITQRGFR